MSKQRYLDTKFWSDGYVEDLDPVEKLLFLYLLTNERTNVAGIYELPRKIMSVETGIEKSMLDKILERFEKDGKIYTYEKWVRLVNSDKHQNLSNSKIQIGRNRIIDALSTEVKDRLYMTHAYVSNNLDSDLDLDSNFDLHKAVAEAPVEKEKLAKEVDEVSQLYYQTVAELQLPIRNHRNLQTRIKALEKEIGKNPSIMYLRFVKQNYMQLDDDGYKPRLAESLDIYAKRVSIKNWIERKLIEQTKPAETGGRPVV